MALARVHHHVSRRTSSRQRRAGSSLLRAAFVAGVAAAAAVAHIASASSWDGPIGGGKIGARSGNAQRETIEEHRGQGKGLPGHRSRGAGIGADGSDEDPKAEDLAVGHRVMRGRDWEWGDQDGGKGGKGTVVELRPWRGEGDRKKFAARVRWDTGAVNSYRWGAEDMFDLAIIGAIDADAARAMRAPAPELPNCNSLDRELLLSVYRATGGDTWPAASAVGWREAAHGNADQDPCIDEWPGVVCEKGRVIALDLSRNGIKSEFPEDVTKLQALKTLNMAQNRMTGPIPASINRLSKMQWLSLHDNKLTGSVPVELGAMGELRWISLFNNKLEGTIPEALGTLPFLEELHLQNNYLTGTIPDTLGTTGSLHTLYLQQNHLTGKLPATLGPHSHVKRIRFPRTVRDVSLEL